MNEVGRALIAWEPTCISIFLSFPSIQFLRFMSLLRTNFSYMIIVTIILSRSRFGFLRSFYWLSLFDRYARHDCDWQLRFNARFKENCQFQRSLSLYNCIAFYWELRSFQFMLLLRPKPLTPNGATPSACVALFARRRSFQFTTLVSIQGIYFGSRRSLLQKISHINQVLNPAASFIPTITLVLHHFSTMDRAQTNYYCFHSFPFTDEVRLKRSFIFNLSSSLASSGNEGFLLLAPRFRLMLHLMSFSSLSFLFLHIAQAHLAED